MILPVMYVHFVQTENTNTLGQTIFNGKPIKNLYSSLSNVL
jgi:hypothetical protein